MENHPIPQDITGFQFKLIGNMTVKQFAYLAAGAILGWVFFVMPLPFIVRLPVTSMLVLAGVGFAFLPIDGRPLDVMITNFVKALSSPTQYLYQKMGGNLYFPEHNTGSQTIGIANAPSQGTASKDKLKALLASLSVNPKNKLDEKEMMFLQSLPSFHGVSMQANQPSATGTNLPNINSFLKRDDSVKKTSPLQKADDEPTTSPQESENEEALRSQAEILKAQLADAKREEASQSLGGKGQQEAHQKVTHLESLLNEALSQKQRLETQLIELQKKLEQKDKKVFAPSMANSEPKPQQTKRVRSIPKEMGKSVGLPLAPDFPNVITGIIKDPRGNPLPGVLVEVKDKEGNPIRAFKTNPLGQFASATPLLNGTYTIEFEDPNKKNSFDTIEFTANGEVILPIEVISADEREELRKTLFG